MRASRRKSVHPNAAVERSIKHGDTQVIGGRTYRGSPPGYAQHPFGAGPVATWVKVKKGIPFVRVN